MLLALPKYGRVKATKLANRCRVSPSKTFGGLSERQRMELAGRFDADANRLPPNTAKGHSRDSP
jgi:hypothetical protein